MGRNRAAVPLYNTAAVVQRTGILASTIRAWERKYAFPQRLQRRGVHLLGQRPAQAGSLGARPVVVHVGATDADAAADLVVAEALRSQAPPSGRRG